MKKQRKRSTGAIITLRMWTHEQAIKAVPYLRSIVGSLREHWLDLRNSLERLQRIDDRRGRPDRETLISRQETERTAERAEIQFEDALSELMELDAFCLDPACGLAVLPFRLGDELAWFIFDLFAPDGVDGWRLHCDPDDVRRPLV